MRADYQFPAGTLTGQEGGYVLTASFRCGHLQKIRVTSSDAAVRAKEYAATVRCSDCAREGKEPSR